MKEELKHELLKEEYFYLQKQSDDFDNRALMIKTWSITISLAGIVTAFLQKAPYIFLISAFSSLLFWIIETLWKTFQHVNYRRIYLIEDYFKGKDIEHFRIPNISGSWNYHYSKLNFRNRLRIAFRPQVMLPHIVITISGLFLFFLQLFGLLKL